MRRPPAATVPGRRQTVNGKLWTAMTLGRSELIGAITSFLAGRDPAILARIKARLESELDAAGPAALAELNDRFAAAGSDWTYYPPDPLARRVHHALAAAMLDERSTVTGLHHLEAVRGRP